MNRVTNTYLDSLNPAQRNAVENTEGPLLVLAGAGTGKTKVLTSRIVHILEQERATASQILAVTFTNKAASEMRHRVESTLARAIPGLWLGTFHAIANRCLRSHAELLGLSASFSILNPDDQLRLMKQLFAREKLREDRQLSPQIALSTINRWKDKALTPAHLASSAEGSRQHNLVKLYQQYQAELRILNACDFGDLLLSCLELFKNHGEVLRSYQQQFRYILVDEYQDTNVAQYLWLQLLGRGYQNLCCVGDDDQSIYGWRGAEVTNILKFKENFPKAQIIRLEENYRSTCHILGAADGLIAHNRQRLGKTLWTSVEGGHKVKVFALDDVQAEVAHILRLIAQARQQGAPLNNFAILVRASSQTREFEAQLVKAKLPYDMVGGMRFYERMEVRDAIAYLRLIVQPYDGLAFMRIINVPRRSVGPQTLQQIQQYAYAQGLSLPEAASTLSKQEMLRGVVCSNLQRFFAHLEGWRQALETQAPAEVACMVLEESGYLAHWQKESSEECRERLENLQELIKDLEKFPSLQAFLEHISLVSERLKDNLQERICLMTLHSAKGLEFDTVFLPGWEEGTFPHPRCFSEKGEHALEEERRLAYVGLTRAKQQAIITYTRYRYGVQGVQATTPSRFLRELPRQHIECVAATLWQGDDSPHKETLLRGVIS